MNTITLMVAILTLWLVMGLGFLSKYAALRKKGVTPLDAWTSYEGIFFVVSVLVPLLALIYRTVSS
ncbi:MAG: hypothetical protein JEZ11_11525 [Desulfobacterales bacterium]|nr:hypothetical protein [Desulfobacterales bacterium]